MEGIMNASSDELKYCHELFVRKAEKPSHADFVQPRDDHFHVHIIGSSRVNTTTESGPLVLEHRLYKERQRHAT